MEQRRKTKEGKASRSRSFIVASQRLAIQNEMDYFGDIFQYEEVDEVLDPHLALLKLTLSEELGSVVDSEFMDVFFEKVSKINRNRFSLDLARDKKKMIVYMFEFSSGRQQKHIYKHILKHYKDLIKKSDENVDIPYASPPSSPKSVPTAPSFLKERMEKMESPSQRKKLRLSLTLLPSFQWEIKGSDVIYSDPPTVIGTGAYGDVYLGKFKNKRVAVKKVPSEEDDIHFLNEISILCQMDHPNIVKFRGATLGNQTSIVMKYESGGDLNKFISKKKGLLKIEEKITMAIHICKGLLYLHKKNVVHGDIKPSNILVSRKRECKLSDFGISSIAKGDRKPKTASIGTEMFMAPELFNGDISHPTKACDIYSLGMTMYQLFEERSPFQETFEWFRAMSTGERPPMSKQIPHEVACLIQRCWSDDIEQRPNLKEVIQVLQETLSVPNKKSPNIKLNHKEIVFV